jgi:protein TonB
MIFVYFMKKLKNMKHLLILISLFFFLFNCSAQSQEKEIIKNDTIYKIVYKNPKFEGVQKFIIDNIKYPDKAKLHNITGVVYVNFVVEKDGTVSNIKILKGIGGGCDEEVIRVTKLMTGWVPGEDKNGNKVRVSFVLPVKFTFGD